jgi:hypothetical protein
MIITHYLKKTPTLLHLVYPFFVFSTIHRNIPKAPEPFHLPTHTLLNPLFQKQPCSLSIVVAACGNLFCASPFHVAVTLFLLLSQHAGTFFLHLPFTYPTFPWHNAPEQMFILWQLHTILPSSNMTKPMPRDHSICSSIITVESTTGAKHL